MKHGIKLRKLQRTPSHRYALLRNLVSALLHHEQIKTTLPKAKEAARMAEKIITLGKRGTNPARQKAEAFLMPSHHYPSSSLSNGPVAPPKPLEYPISQSTHTDPETFEPPTSLLPKLFTTLSKRYHDRPGGYTRIQKFGKRPGDNAPVAILSLVGGPRDMKFEMVARALGKETVRLGIRGDVKLDAAVDGEAETAYDYAHPGLRERTRYGIERVLKYRGEEGRAELEKRASAFADELIAENTALGGHRHKEERPDRPKFLAVS
ncbi:large subunit ribosomal protein L17, partial [Tremellales sp. Uapishka_1]